MSARRVAVTGLGVISPLGNDEVSFFDGLQAGRSGVCRLDTPFSERLSTRIGAPVALDGSACFSPPKLRMLDRVSQFALVAAQQAVGGAGSGVFDGGHERTGVFLGTGMGGGQTVDDGYRALYADGAARLPPFSVLMAMNHAAAAWIGIEYGLCGPNLTYSTACSSSAVAIGEAWRRIRDGETDVMLAGGSEAPLNLGTLKAWEALRTLATEDADDPAASCKPFALDRSGMVLGEGAAVLVLEEWEHAQRRGARIRGELIGYGLCTDSTHMTHPTVQGQARAMALALESAAIDASAVGYINAHGTGTAANDVTETRGIREVFAAHADRVPVSSTKSMHGHLLGAAGALELVATLLALERGTLPPTINLRNADPACDLDYISQGARKVSGVDVAMSNAFAFGGTNAVLVCRSAASAEA
ncbi:MAG: beta-ketoacyl-[acyl-carrier-protein] synthase family protein [Pseudoxanthomonas sp.]|nr:beta-ketoacyl-[acyl-carrier-protein] synthase family protein [Pseudoxanthomonas sp.]